MLRSARTATSIPLLGSGLRIAGAAWRQFVIFFCQRVVCRAPSSTSADLAKNGWRQPIGRPYAISGIVTMATTKFAKR